MEKKMDDVDFVDVQDFIKKLMGWMTNPDLGLGRNLRLEDGAGGTFSRAVLLEKRLSDGSFVYDVRLS